MSLIGSAVRVQVALYSSSSSARNGFDSALSSPGGQAQASASQSVTAGWRRGTRESVNISSAIRYNPQIPRVMAFKYVGTHVTIRELGGVISQ